MSYESMPIEALRAEFERLGRNQLNNRQNLELGNEVAEIGRAIVARGNAGETALRDLLDSADTESMRVFVASWLIKLNAKAALPTLESVRDNGTFPNNSSARLVLLHARNEGLISA